MSWVREWPKEEGWYWFYGVRNKGYQRLTRSPVECRRISNGFIYVLEGHFAFPKEAGPAWFKKIEEPEDPGFLMELEIEYEDRYREKTANVMIDLSGPEPVIHGKPGELADKTVLGRLQKIAR